MNINIQRFFDGAFSVIIIFFFACFGFSFAVDNKVLLFIASVAAAFSGGALWCGFLGRKKTSKDYSVFLPLFLYRTSTENMRFFFEKFSAKYKCDLNGNKIDFGKFDLMFILKPDALSCNQAVALSLAVKKKTLIVVTKAAKGATGHAAKAGNRLAIAEFTSFAPLLDKIGALPEIEKVPLKKKLSSFLDAALCRKNAKRFFPAAGLMLVLSAINGFSVWFLTFSALSAALGIISVFRRTDQKAEY